MPIPPLLADLPWYVAAAIPLVLITGYTIFGATGFGSSIVSVPLLAHIFPLAFAVPLVTTLDAVAATGSGVRLRRSVAWAEFRRLLPPALIGIALGATLIVKLPSVYAVLALGLFVTTYGTYLLAGPRTLRRAPAWLVWPVGVAGGIFSALFGSGGPVYMIYLSARITDKAALRATSAAVVTISAWVRVAAFASAGLLSNPALIFLAVTTFPVMLLGLALGNRLHHRLSGAGVLRLIAALLVGNGVTLLVRALAELRGD